MLKRGIILGAALLCLAACQSHSDLSIRESESAMGKYEIGMKRSQVHVLNPAIEFPNSKEACIEAALRKEDMVFLFEHGILMRISTANAAMVTEKDIHVGDTKEKLMKAYEGELVVQPHKYDNTGNYLFHIGPNGRGILFETSKDKITAIHVGQVPALNYVEGCL